MSALPKTLSTCVPPKQRYHHSPSSIFICHCPFVARQNTSTITRPIRVPSPNLFKQYEPFLSILPERFQSPILLRAILLAGTRSQLSTVCYHIFAPHAHPAQPWKRTKTSWPPAAGWLQATRNHLPTNNLWDVSCHSHFPSSFLCFHISCYLAT